MLRERNEHPERLAEIDARIRSTFTSRHAVLVLDMAGFSRLTMKYGVVHFLAMIERMQSYVLPIIAGGDFGGRTVKTEADNVFALFPDVPEALRCALRIRDDMARVNELLPEDWDVHVSIGIGYGDLLVVGDDDLFGNEMNLASKLGEDVAGPAEILLTAAAGERVSADVAALEPGRCAIGGLSLEYRRVVPR